LAYAINYNKEYRNLWHMSITLKFDFPLKTLRGVKNSAGVFPGQTKANNKKARQDGLFTPSSRFSFVSL
jgi:hypothetical protein